jgi:hypothetical protein
MSSITTTQVFNFCGTASDMRTDKATMIQTLIDEVDNSFLALTGRSPILVSETININNGIKCRIIDDMLYLKGKYRDIVSITTLKEEGVTLNESTTYNDSKDFIIHKEMGAIQLIDDAWSLEPLAIQIEGKFGLVTMSGSSFATNKDVQNIITEMVAVKSGLWTRSTQTEDGDIVSTRTTLNEDTKKSLNKYILRDFV